MQGWLPRKGPSPEGECMGTLADRRRTEILALLDSQRSLSIGELSRLLGAPEATLRKDLALLADLGLLKLLSDGAAAIPHYRISRERQERMQLNREKKIRIGEAAASLIHPGESVILDAGTTPLQVASHICSDLRLAGGLTMVTSSLRISVRSAPAPVSARTCWAASTCPNTNRRRVRRPWRL